MPTALLDSQIATLEPLQPDERGLVVDIGLDIATAVERVEVWLDTSTTAITPSVAGLRRL
jgi:gluconate kinase